MNLSDDEMVDYVAERAKVNYQKVPIKVSTNDEYRLGDMILDRYWRYQDGARDDHLEYFPDSIASEYMRRTDDEENMDVLEDIVSRRRYSKPSKLTFVWHLRVGDVIEDVRETFQQLLVRGNDYVPNLYTARTNLECARRLGYKRIDIVYGVHERRAFPKTRKFLAAIRAFCQYHGFDTRLVTHKDADRAFVYMASATAFAPSGGGFSWLIAKIVAKRHGADAVCATKAKRIRSFHDTNWK